MEFVTSQLGSSRAVRPYPFFFVDCKWSKAGNTEDHGWGYGSLYI